MYLQKTMASLLMQIDGTTYKDGMTMGYYYKCEDSYSFFVTRSQKGKYKIEYYQWFSSYCGKSSIWKEKTLKEALSIVKELFKL